MNITIGVVHIDKNNYKKDNLSLKIVAYWFAIPRIWRRSVFWGVMFTLAIVGWFKIINKYL